MPGSHLSHPTDFFPPALVLLPTFITLNIVYVRTRMDLSYKVQSRVFFILKAKVFCDFFENKRLA